MDIEEYVNPATIGAVIYLWVIITTYERKSDGDN